MTSTPTEDRARPHNRWLIVATNVELRRRAGLTDRPPDAVSLREHITMIARAQFGVDLSYDRMRAAQLDRAGLVMKDADRALQNDAMFRAFLEAHAFLVSAASFWNLLSSLLERFEQSALDTAVEKHAGSKEQALRARHHIEHVAERIEAGRAARFGGEMTSEEFLSAVGSLEGDEMIFGPERFNLRQIRDVTHLVTGAVAPGVNEHLKVTFIARAEEET
jgi:hypothetical protein